MVLMCILQSKASEMRKEFSMVECTTDCIHCKSYYACESAMKLDAETRDFWLNEEEVSEVLNNIRAE